MNDVDPNLVEDPYPLQNLIGFRMRDWSKDYARFDLDLRDELMNRYGIPHGGVYAMLLDTVMGYSGSYTGDPDRRRLAMTLSMTTNFLSRPTGTTLIGEGRRRGGGASTFFSEGTITDEANTLVATATGVFRLRASD
ncbi:uncharacterized protein (TIGR00369 family) [Palleronia aestuarii]|uniref:Uncharacterized protein (TIGR00369 family) n=1 Tax=Palleronia aestuarii TaxID=568105 RepID=A0A2W7MUH8_9RHOB|nr:PaaI family thioesterase [Palleronia aestuarii]PZX11221.1 uncharacterized protein (TIGR00369 family) [Palleronia aestuarii]